MLYGSRPLIQFYSCAVCRGNTPRSITRWTAEDLAQLARLERHKPFDASDPWTLEDLTRCSERDTEQSTERDTTTLLAQLLPTIQSIALTPHTILVCTIPASYDSKLYDALLDGFTHMREQCFADMPPIPLILLLEGATLEALDEAQMNTHGWYRKES
jgi:hypothetical protein